jgi:hypothetical protein
MTSNNYLPNTGEKGRDSDRLSSDGSTQTVYQNGLHDYETTGAFGEPTANAVDISGKIHDFLYMICRNNLSTGISNLFNYSCQG